MSVYVSICLMCCLLSVCLHFPLLSSSSFSSGVFCVFFFKLASRSALLKQ